MRLGIHPLIPQELHLVHASLSGTSSFARNVILMCTKAVTLSLVPCFRCLQYLVAAVRCQYVSDSILA